MRHLCIRLRAISPLAIRSDHSPESAGSAASIPGTTLIGALAAVHRLLYPEKTEEFERFFLREQILYPDLYPATFDDSGLQGRESLPVYPAPMTAQTCKRHPGFLFPKKEENDAHGVRDGLIDWGLFELGQREKFNPHGTDSFKALEAYKTCRFDGCGERMDSFKGYYRRNDVNEKQLISAKEHKRLQTHSGIDRRSGTVQEGILYTRQVFEEGMRFWGSGILSEDERLFSDFVKFIDTLGDKKLGNDGLLRVGTGRTRGMGRVALTVEQAPIESDPFEAFQKRLQAFNKLIHEQAERFKLAIPENHFFFALTLHSPLLLYDKLLRCRGNIDVQTLADLLKEKRPDCSILGLKQIYQHARLRRVTGWLELWGTPRTNEYAIEAGSVFLFTCPSQPGREVYQALFELEEQGVGRRRTEGFGRLSVSDQFHQEIEAL